MVANSEILTVVDEMTAAITSKEAAMEAHDLKEFE
jgi:hypothetical protein